VEHRPIESLHPVCQMGGDRPEMAKIFAVVPLLIKAPTLKRVVRQAYIPNPVSMIKTLIPSERFQYEINRNSETCSEHHAGDTNVSKLDDMIRTSAIQSYGCLNANDLTVQVACTMILERIKEAINEIFLENLTILFERNPAPKES
jgi:hypothetical protein